MSWCLSKISQHEEEKIQMNIEFWIHVAHAKLIMNQMLIAEKPIELLSPKDLDNGFNG
ncbi:MAG: hypothetical protein BAJATHORv1_30120 [Candidatus Thorarchaeota archaeon]|nr:MAG: hypothetical protein BAJATHORv1_30120 [Candidatus Thorarchaeota archaeon]